MSINNTINGLASLSFEARVIADRLHQSAASSDTQALKAKIGDLQNTIAMLQLQRATGVSPKQSTLSDDEIADFQKRFGAAIKPVSTIILESVYTQKYFADLSDSIRAAAARCVASEFSKRGLDVPSFLNDF